MKTETLYVYLSDGVVHVSDYRYQDVVVIDYDVEGSDMPSLEARGLLCTDPHRGGGNQIHTHDHFPQDHEHPTAATLGQVQSALENLFNSIAITSVTEGEDSAPAFVSRTALDEVRALIYGPAKED